MVRTSISFCVSILLLMLISSCQDDSGEIVRLGIEEFNMEEQIVIGNQIHEYIQTNNTEHLVLSKINYKEAYDYLDLILQMAVTTGQVQNKDDFSWSIHMIYNDEKSKAFTLPGGHIYIYTGLLKFLKAENELFSLITHEMAYADLGIVGEFLGEIHGPKKMGDIYLANEHSDFNDVIRSMEELPFEREEVKLADEFSVNLACQNFNFDDRALISLLDRSKRSSEQVEWFKTRPSYDKRHDEIMKMTDLCKGVEQDEATYKTNILDYLP